jgi:hypothetical protein
MASCDWYEVIPGLLTLCDGTSWVPAPTSVYREINRPSQSCFRDKSPRDPAPPDLAHLPPYGERLSYGFKLEEVR